jgi:hypothetical protein
LIQKLRNQNDVSNRQQSFVLAAILALSFLLYE